MKRLTVMRHGKAQERNTTTLDKERTLRERGRKASRRMGEFYAGLLPDLIVSSSAVRAIETATLFAEGAGYSKEIEIDDLIYQGSGSGSLNDLLEAIRKQQAGHLMIVGHNVPISDLVCFLDARDRSIAGRPVLVTAAAAHLIFEELDEWQNLTEDSGRLRALISPRFLKALAG